MQATISSKQIDIRPFVIAALAACLVAAAIIAVTARGDESSARVAPLASWTQAADTAFIEQNLYLPTGRIAVTAPGYAEMQFAEKNLVLPVSRAAAPGYTEMQFVEQNLALPGKSVTAPGYADVQFVEQNLHLPALAAPTTDAPTLMLIEENSWGAGFTFDAAYPSPGTLPQAHDGAESY